MKTNVTVKTIAAKSLPVVISCVLICATAALMLMRTQQPKYTAEVHLSSTNKSLNGQSIAIELQQLLEQKGTPPRAFTSSALQNIPAEAPFNVTCRDLGVGYTSQSMTVKQLKGDKYQITAEVYGIEKKVTAAEGEEFKLGSLALTINHKNNTRTTASNEYQIEVISPAQTIQELIQEGSLNVEAQGTAAVVKVTDTDPSRAAQLAGMIAEVAHDNPIYVSSAENIANQISEVNDRLLQHDQNIAAYKRTHGLTDLENDVEASNQYLNELKTRKAELELQMVALGNLHTYIRTNIEGSYTGMEYDVITDPAFNESVSRINDRYIQKSAAGLQTAASDTELQSMKDALSERILNTRRKIAVKIDQMAGLLSIHQAKQSQFPIIAAGLQQLEREKTADQKAFDILTEQYAQKIAAATSLPKQLPETVQMPVKANGPAAWMVLSIAAFAGAGIGLLLSLKRIQKSSQYIHDRKAFQQTGTKIKFLGSLRHMSPGNPAEDSSFSELCTRFLLQPDAKMITVTSAAKGEGKSFVATNFARYMAALDKKVLLIDLNMYAPVLANQFGVNTENTLNDALEGQCDIHECIQITNFPNLEILTAGSFSMGMNTLLLSRQTSSVFEKLRRHYDIIIIDTPEAGTYIDAVPMMKMSDMTFFVVRAQKSSKTVLEEAEQITSDFGINNLFLVLNDAKSGVNHSGSKTGKVVRLNPTEKTGQKSSPVHNVFRKIALWFY